MLVSGDPLPHTDEILEGWVTMFGPDFSQPISINPRFGGPEERGSPVPSEASSTATAAPAAPEYYNYGQTGPESYGGYGYQPFGRAEPQNDVASGSLPDGTVSITAASTRMVAQNTWAIANYMSQPDEKLVSPVFGPSDYRWQMVAYTKGVGDGRDRYLGVFLRPLRNDKEEAAGDSWSRPIVNFSIKLLLGDQVVASDTSAESFMAFDARVPGWGFTTLYDLVEISSALSYDGTLTISAEVCWDTIAPSTSLTYSWTVPQFQDQADRIALAESNAISGQPPQQQLLSSVFGPPDRTWQLYLFPNGDKEARGSFLSCFLHVVPTTSERSQARWTRSVTSFTLRIRRANANSPLDSISSKTLTGGHIFTASSVSCGWTQMFELGRLQEALDWYGGLTVDVEVVWDDEAHATNRPFNSVAVDEAEALRSENHRLLAEVGSKSDQAAQATAFAESLTLQMEALKAQNDAAVGSLRTELEHAKRAVEVSTMDTGRLATKFAAVSAELEDALKRLAESDRIRERLAEVQQEFQVARSSAQEKIALRTMLLGTRAKVAKILARMLTEEVVAQPASTDNHPLEYQDDDQDAELYQPRAVLETKIGYSGVWEDGPVTKEVWVDEDPFTVAQRADSGEVALREEAQEGVVQSHGSQTLEDVYSFDPVPELVSFDKSTIDVHEQDVYVADAGVNTAPMAISSAAEPAQIYRSSSQTERPSIVAMLAPSISYSGASEAILDEKDGWDEDEMELDLSDTEGNADHREQIYMGPPRKKEGSVKPLQPFQTNFEQPKEARRTRVVDYKGTQTGTIARCDYAVQSAHAEKRLENAIVGYSKAVQFTTEYSVSLPPSQKSGNIAELNAKLKQEVSTLKAELVQQKILATSFQERLEAAIGEAEVAKLERAEVLLRFASKKGRQGLKHQRSFSSRKDVQEHLEVVEEEEEEEEDDMIPEDDEEVLGEGGVYTSVKALRSALEHVRTECAAARVALSDTTGFGESPDTEVERAAMSAELAMVQAELEVARASLVDAEAKTPTEIITSSDDHTEGELIRVKTELSGVLAQLMESRAKLEEPHSLKLLFGDVVKLVIQAGGLEVDGPGANEVALRTEIETLKVELADTKNKMAAARTALEGFGIFASGGATSSTGSVSAGATAGYGNSGPYFQGRRMSIASAGANSSASVPTHDVQAHALNQQQQQARYYNEYYSQQGYSDGSYAQQAYGDGSYGQTYGDSSYAQAGYGTEYGTYGYEYGGESGANYSQAPSGYVDSSAALVDELQIVQEDIPVPGAESAPQNAIQTDTIAPMTDDSSADVRKGSTAGPPKSTSGIPPPPTSGIVGASSRLRSRRGKPGVGGGFSLPPMQEDFEGDVVDGVDPEGGAPLNKSDNSTERQSTLHGESGEDLRSGMWTPVPDGANDSQWGPQVRAQTIAKSFKPKRKGSFLSTILSLFFFSVVSSSFFVTTLYASCNPPRESVFSRSKGGIFVTELCNTHVAPAWSSFRAVYVGQGGPTWVLDHGRSLLDGASGVIHFSLPTISRALLTATKSAPSASYVESENRDSELAADHVVDLDGQTLVEEEFQSTDATTSQQTHEEIVSSRSEQSVASEEMGEVGTSEDASFVNDASLGSGEGVVVEEPVDPTTREERPTDVSEEPVLELEVEESNIAVVEGLVDSAASDEQGTAASEETMSAEAEEELVVVVASSAEPESTIEVETGVGEETA